MEKKVGMQMKKTLIFLGFGLLSRWRGERMKDKRWRCRRTKIFLGFGLLS